MSNLTPDSAVSRGPHGRLPLPPSALAGFAAAAVAVLLIVFLFHRSTDATAESTLSVNHMLDVVDQLELLLSNAKDAETGQRGYLLTGSDAYLQPYTAASAAIPVQLAALKSLAADNPAQQRQLQVLGQLLTEKLDITRQTIELRGKGDVQGSLAVVVSDRGKLTMDRIRTIVADMVRDERQILVDREDQLRAVEETSSTLVFAGSALLLILISIFGYIASRDYRARELQTWLRTGQMGLTQRLQGEQRLAVLGERVLEFLATYLGARVGAVYLSRADGSLRCIAGYAMSPHAGDADIGEGAGLLGQAARNRRPLSVRDVPDGYLEVNSSLGHAKSVELLIAPAIADGTVQAVIELGFFRALTQDDEELATRISESLAVAVRTSADRTRLEELLEQTQRQSEELQTQQEELRVSNEELEEQGRSLKESTARLEEQRSELEQTNAQLEEQAEMLESQKDALADAQAILQRRATELERADQYKSEFLANMSHELRTPLNSTLILSKLLADNKSGNLSSEQARFAETIHAAGNDLLALINDILDLSKIEARKVELDIGRVRLTTAIETLTRTLAPIAEQKHVRFSSKVDPDAPTHVETDAQRLAQIIRNLVSNALKFTEQGEVSLRVFPGSPGMVSFAVRDTGIGIPAEQQQVIFEAFRQADGSTHRRYGGTGLGLSISRDLARLLGGDIALTSAPGQGSTFTLSLPIAYAGDATDERDRYADAAPQSRVPAMESAPANRRPAPPESQPPGPHVADDRENLRPGSRTILVIEDDPRFAAILRDLAHEMTFQCVIAHTARDGIDAAIAFRPKAILLDINLPDKSGMGVLDDLKRNPDLRAIPVHVASVSDYARQALERGAIGYDLKPVKREQLVAAFRHLEAKFSQGIRQLLVVEDDERQRDSIRQLLSMDDVQITDVKSAAEALAALQHTSFDCVVMDLNLPDLSGYQLLEQMAAVENVSFPPVIVYTGRSLTRDEEQALRRFANSIIIKGARSPERLLDEVTLFLHQVETTLPPERQQMLKRVRDRDAMLEGRRILIVEDDVRNVFALSSVLEPLGVTVQIARNGKEALAALDASRGQPDGSIDLVLMDIMMPEMDGLTAMREIRRRPEWKKLPVIALTAKAMPDDQETCVAAGANDYIAKPLDADKLISLVRVWMPKRLD
ncbi:MAG: response regulator [Casimicrobiaceae bacterium]